MVQSQSTEFVYYLSPITRIHTHWLGVVTSVLLITVLLVPSTGPYKQQINTCKRYTGRERTVQQREGR
jgi:hypothetical protein